MKKNYIITMLLFLCSLAASAQDNPCMTTMDLTAAEMAHYMAPAWNLGNTMEAGDYTKCYKNSGTGTETWWQSTKTTQAVINQVAAQGFKSVRIPCAWVMGHITDKSTMTIDPAWITRVKQVIDYCLNANLNVFINDHWDGGWLEYDGFTSGADVDALNETLRKLWTNIATALKDYDERVMFGGLNEPGVGGASPAASGSLIFSQYGTSTDAQMKNFVSRIQKYEQTFIDAVRATGGNNAKRILVVQGPQVNIDKTVSYFDMSKFTDSADNRLMVEVHYYDPYVFCQCTEDTQWYNQEFYWYNSGYNVTTSTHKATGYYTDATTSSTLKKMKTKFVDQGYPVIIGEYGAMWRNLSSKTDENQNSHNNSLQYWYDLVTKTCLQNGLIPFQWDTNNSTYGGSSSVNRKTLGTGISWIVNGVESGTKAGIDAYNEIYPEPSSNTGVDMVENVEETPSDVYAISGVKVLDKMCNFTKANLSHGIYIYKGRKYIVK